MSKADIPKSRGVAVIGRYALVVARVLATLLATLLLRPNGLVPSLFFFVIIVSAWFEGTGPLWATSRDGRGASFQFTPSIRNRNA